MATIGYENEQFKIEFTKLGLEDIFFGISSQQVERFGEEYTITEINAANLPFDASHTLQEVLDSNYPSVELVGDEIAKVVTVANDIVGVVLVAENMTVVLAAQGYSVAAASSAVEAADSASSALASKSLAEKWASEPENSVVAGGKYSAFHWAQKAEEIVIGDNIHLLLTGGTLTGALSVVANTGEVGVGNVANNHFIGLYSTSEVADDVGIISAGFDGENTMKLIYTDTIGEMKSDATTFKIQDKTVLTEDTGLPFTGGTLTGDLLAQSSDIKMGVHNTSTGTHIGLYADGTDAGLKFIEPDQTAIKLLYTDTLNSMKSDIPILKLNEKTVLTEDTGVSTTTSSSQTIVGDILLHANTIKLGVHADMTNTYGYLFADGTNVGLNFVDTSDPGGGTLKMLKAETVALLESDFSILKLDGKAVLTEDANVLKENETIQEIVKIDAGYGGLDSGGLLIGDIPNDKLISIGLSHEDKFEINATIATHSVHNVLRGDYDKAGVLSTDYPTFKLGTGYNVATTDTALVKTPTGGSQAMTGALQVTTLVFDTFFNNGTETANFTIDPTNGQYQKITIDADITMALTNPAGPCTIYLHIYQGATGGSVTFPTAKWAGGTVKANTTTPTTGYDILTIHYTGALVLDMLQDLS